MKKIRMMGIERERIWTSVDSMVSNGGGMDHGGVVGGGWRRESKERVWRR